MESIEFCTVHADEFAIPVWIAAITDDLSAYVWVPEFGTFHFNEAITADRQWDQQFTYRPLSDDAAKKLCEEGVIGRQSDPVFDWAYHTLAVAPTLTVDWRQ